jgi:predicted DNA-binding protein
LYNKSTYTSTLPEELIKQLKEVSARLSVPKNKIIEKALRIYLEQIERADYIASFREMQSDEDLLLIAEEGMAEYLKQTEA